MSLLSELSWDGIAKTIGAVGTAADKISQAAEVLGERKGTQQISNELGRTSSSGNNSGLLAGLALIAGVLFLKRI